MASDTPTTSAPRCGCDPGHDDCVCGCHGPYTEPTEPPSVWRARMRLRHINYGHGEISQLAAVDFDHDVVIVVSPEGVESEWEISDVREVSE